MDGDPLERGAVNEEVVHPRRVQPLEEVVRRHDAQVMLQLEQCFIDLIDEVGLYGVREDGVPLLGDTPEVVLHLRHGAGALVSHVHES